MASKMQYLVSLSDETIEKVIELEKDWGIDRDSVIDQAINYTYQSNLVPKKTVVDAVQEVVSSFAVAFIQEQLAQGRKISIPSLGIVIEP